MFYYLYIIVFNIFIQGDVDTKLNKELGADQMSFEKVHCDYSSVSHSLCRDSSGTGNALLFGLKLHYPIYFHEVKLL